MPVLGSHVQIKEDVLFQELQGEAVLLNLASGTYFGLDRVGTRIWQLFSTHPRLTDIAHAIVSEFDVAPDRCAADLLKLVADLESHGLVTVTQECP